VQHVSSWEVLRAEAGAGTPVGRELAAYQERHAQVIARELWLATEWHPPADGEEPTGPDFRSATSKHPRCTASLMTKSRIQARMG